MSFTHNTGAKGANRRGRHIYEVKLMPLETTGTVESRQCLFHEMDGEHSDNGNAEARSWAWLKPDVRDYSRMRMELLLKGTERDSD
jgi:hypothetical protein